jgi:hypothetical protein
MARRHGKMKAAATVSMLLLMSCGMQDDSDKIPANIQGPAIARAEARVRASFANPADIEFTRAYIFEENGTYIVCGKFALRESASVTSIQRYIVSAETLKVMEPEVAGSWMGGMWQTLCIKRPR